jgi:hypothetical protein
LPEGICEPIKKKGSSDVEVTVDGKKKKLGPCGGGGTVPEPATWILFASGLVFLVWHARGRFVRTQA